MKNILLILAALLLLSACGGSSSGSSSSSSSTTVSQYSDEELEDLITSDDTKALYGNDAITAALDALAVEDVDFTDDYYSDYTFPYTELNAASSSYEITAAGTYVLSGIIPSTVWINIDDDDDDVRLVLNGVDITSADGPAIAIIDAGDVVISVVPGTVNNLEDAATRDTDEDGEYLYPRALYSKCDLVLNGSGTLNIVGNHEDGLYTKKDLKLINLTLNVTSVDDGITGKNSVAIYAANITVDADGDALKSTEDDEDEPDKGYVYIASGTFNLTSGDDGISAENVMLIYGGDFTIDAAGKAIKSESAIAIGGGTFDIVSTDDGIDSNTNLSIYEGTFSLASGDDAIKATSTLSVFGGTIEISDCYEGLEAEDLVIRGGYLNIASLDDAINAASDAGVNTFYIDGGAIVASPYADEGDAIDINGSAEFNGGVIIANGPAAIRDNAIDIDDDFEVNAGKIFTFGNAMLAVAPSTSSSQPSILFTPDSTFDAGTLVTLLDAAGDEIMSLASLHGFNHVILSHPDLNTSSSYTVEVGSTVSVTVSLSSIVTYIDEDGETTAPATSDHH